MRRAIDRAVKTDTVGKEKDRKKEEEPKVTAIATEAATISKDTWNDKKSINKQRIDLNIEYWIEHNNFPQKIRHNDKMRIKNKKYE